MGIFHPKEFKTSGLFLKNIQRASTSKKSDRKKLQDFLIWFWIQITIEMRGEKIDVGNPELQPTNGS